MYSSINPDVTEVNALVERLRARADLLPLKARGLKRFAAELKAISEIGLPWKAVWRILRDVGYQGTYRQFVAMNHLRNTVRFHDNMIEAHTRRDTIFLEVGPQRVLQQLANRLPLSTKNQIALSSVASEKTEHVSLLSTLGSLWVRGVPIDWNSVFNKKDVHRISLPAYPFERQRCWVERAGKATAEVGESAQHVDTVVTPNGKGSIPISLHSRPHLSTPYLAPSTPTQIRLVSILEPVFGVTPLGVHDNFFALGADSLMAVSVVSQLKEHFGVQLEAVHLYEALDIASLAGIIDEMVAESIQAVTLSDPVSVASDSSGME